MNLSTITPAKGSVKSRKRVGRGQGSGEEELQQEVIKGRNPDQVQDKKGFEGGQMPLQRRLPKFRIY